MHEFVVAFNKIVYICILHIKSIIQNRSRIDTTNPRFIQPCRTVYTVSTGQKIKKRLAKCESYSRTNGSVPVFYLLL